jgi:hypothetical protein
MIFIQSGIEPKQSWILVKISLFLANLFFSMIAFQKSDLGDHFEYLEQQNFCSLLGTATGSASQMLLLTHQ